MQVAIVSILMTSTIALVAYFYKEWKNKIESYIQQLSKILWVIHNNEQILQLMLAHNVQARKIRTKLELLPAFTLGCLPFFDFHIFKAISRLNASIISIKNSVVLLELNLRVSLLEIEIYRELLENIFKFIINVLYNNAFWYYVFSWQLRRLMEKKNFELNQFDDHSPENKQPKWNDVI